MVGYDASGKIYPFLMAWIEFAPLGKIYPTRYWWSPTLDEVAWAPPKGSSRPLESLDLQLQEGLIAKVKACRLRASAKKNRYIAAAVKYAAAQDWRASATAIAGALEAAPRDGDFRDLALAHARATFALWATTANEDARQKAYTASKGYFALSASEEDKVAPPMFVFEAATLLAGIGKPRDALTLFRRLLPTTGQRKSELQHHAVLWCAALLFALRGHGDETACEYLSWVAEAGETTIDDHKYREKVAVGLSEPAPVPRWIVSLVVARAHIVAGRQAQARASLRDARRRSTLDPRVLGSLEADTFQTDTEWIGDARIWSCAGSALAASGHPMLAATAFAAACELLPTSMASSSGTAAMYTERAVCERLIDDGEGSIKSIDVALETKPSCLEARRLAREWSPGHRNRLDAEESILAQGPQALVRRCLAKERVIQVRKGAVIRAREDAAKWASLRPFCRRVLASGTRRWLLHWASNARLCKSQKVAGSLVIQAIMRRRLARNKVATLVVARRGAAAMRERTEHRDLKRTFFAWCRGTALQKLHRIAAVKIQAVGRRKLARRARNREAHIRAAIGGRRLRLFLAWRRVVVFEMKARRSAPKLQRAGRTFLYRRRFARYLAQRRHVDNKAAMALLKRADAIKLLVFTAIKAEMLQARDGARTAASTTLQRTWRNRKVRRRAKALADRRTRFAKECFATTQAVARLCFHALKQGPTACRLQRAVRSSLARAVVKKRRQRNATAAALADRCFLNNLGRLLRAWRETHRSQKDAAILIQTATRGRTGRRAYVGLLRHYRGNLAKVAEMTRKRGRREQQRHFLAWAFVVEVERARRTIGRTGRRYTARKRFTEAVRRRRRNVRLIARAIGAREARSKDRAFTAWQRDTHREAASRRIGHAVRHAVWRARFVRNFAKRQCRRDILLKAIQSREWRERRRFLADWAIRARIESAAVRVTSLFRVLVNPRPLHSRQSPSPTCVWH